MYSDPESTLYYVVNYIRSNSFESAYILHEIMTGNMHLISSAPSKLTNGLNVALK